MTMQNKENCPLCGNYMKKRVWREQGCIVEIDQKCSCGYEYRWAYGLEEETFPEVIVNEY